MVKKNSVKYALIIGAMKCGTTSLFRYLRQHPQIAGSLKKEPQFFSDQKKYNQGLFAYNRLWLFAGLRNKIRLEASTNYTKFPVFQQVPERIKSYGIQPKLIYLVRNPIDRILSHYNHSILHGRDCTIRDEHLLQVSKYHLQLSSYLREFPREDLLILDYQEFSRTPLIALEQVTDFLGVKDFNFDVAKRHNISNYNVSKKTKLTEEEYQFLYKELKEDMQLFQEAIGFDVSKWGF